MLARPEISGVFTMHSVLSFAGAALLCHRWFSIKANKLKWNDVRFGGKE